MSWLVELFVVLVLLGVVFYMFAAAPQGPLAASSNRQTAESIYTNVLKLLYDPSFLDQLGRAVCNDGAARAAVASMIRAAVGPVAYNFTVVPSGRLPACLRCRQPGAVLYNSTSPYDAMQRRGYSGPFSWTLTTKVMLPDGGEVMVFMGVGRP